MIDFLETLSIKERALIYKNMQKLVEYKNNNFNLSDKFTKHLRDGIFELKVDLQNTTSRSLYFYEKNSKSTIKRDTKSYKNNGGIQK
ncbi:MAG: type II toxin-antitoxin system RelE/ParE family toxin [Sulfurimonas sp.]|nr:type II toxin-antitoxin system RelE/ParE family toxin [Sulfurimonas sp.]